MCASDLTPRHKMAAVSQGIISAFQEYRRETAKVKRISERPYLSKRIALLKSSSLHFIGQPALAAKKARNSEFCFPVFIK